MTAPNEPTIRGYDASGRPVDIPKQKWADEMLPQALAQAAADPNATANLLGFALQNGCADKILDAAKKFARTDPDRIRGRNIYGAALAATGNFDEAEKEIENLLVFGGDEPTALVNLAQIKARKGEAKEASDCVKRAIAADPNHAGAFEIVAQNGRKANGDAGFLATCRELAKDPRAWRARLWIARARLGLGEFDQSLALYREALQGGGANAEALTQITGDLANAGRLADAAALVGPLYKAQAHGPYVALNLVRIYGRLGRTADARTVLDEAKKLFGPQWAPTFDQLEKELTGAKPAGDGSVA
jgi:Flp pilus assembly protein TadD